MLLFVYAPTIWFAIFAALGAGASCLIANSVTRAALVERTSPKKTAAVMAVWAIAWAGSKPLASLVDGVARYLDRTAVHGAAARRRRRFFPSW